MFDTLIKPIRPLTVQRNEFTLAVDTEVARDYIERMVKDDLTDVLSDLVGGTVKLRFQCDAIPATSLPQLYIRTRL